MNKYFCNFFLKSFFLVENQDFTYKVFFNSKLF